MTYEYDEKYFRPITPEQRKILMNMWPTNIYSAREVYLEQEREKNKQLTDLMGYIAANPKPPLYADDAKPRIGILDKVRAIIVEYIGGKK